MYHLWTKEEEEFLCDSLDRVVGESFPGVSQTATEVQSDFVNNFEQGASQPTHTQIFNKIHGIARSLGIKPDDLLRNWADHVTKVRTKLEARKRGPAPKKRRRKMESELFSDEDAFQSNNSHNNSQKNSAARESEVAESSPAGSPEAPTTSPLSECNPSLTQHNEADTDLPLRRHSMDLDEWEYKFLTYLRAHRGTIGYATPLAHEHIQQRLQKTMYLMDESFVRFMQGTRTIMPTSSRLTGQSLELVRVLVDSTKDEAAKRRLKTLVAGPHMSDRVLFRACAAAAIYKWALNPFDQSVRHVPSPDCDQCKLFDICDHFNHHLVRNVSVNRFNQYLDKVIRPSLPGRASEIQEKLYNVFISISVPSARVGNSENEGFEFQDRKLGQWQESIETALLELLDMRTTMAKCMLVYGSRLPSIGHPFEAEWMEPAHREDNRFTTSDRVYLCLRPAVFAHNRLDNPRPKILVSPALVMVEGYEADLTQT
ncbi:uncharacterized protein Z520_11563 [Fonsecaea multimorphosa CBS 102226]|uniref:Uncharacterized protein n=1 Tax=Fonsecaea multimorphosa CBS 102226 TaxID=1442371 RepID=A0A0D2I620_9EURO|nr:uncharacterized protein Z520_11563 [Fonsecaea multimorphosa CBS 102226]KIX92711.1 hypothetical protein Z520_11563 [Fonsecaea multimorphosa CBS 102226]OAL17953.1 hypothetical protein AYO22_11109 [Fonsecaea multimorphosa]